MTLAFSLSINIMDLNLICCSLSSICLLVFQVFSTRRSCFISVDAFHGLFQVKFHDIIFYIYFLVVKSLFCQILNGGF